MAFRLALYEFLATPGHLWLWCCARVCGGRFECGPVDHPDDPLDGATPKD